MKEKEKRAKKVYQPPKVHHFGNVARVTLYNREYGMDRIARRGLGSA